MKKLPLSGIRVLDLSRVFAAPTCAQILGDLGAEVIKVERARVGDDGRHFGVYGIQGADGKPTNDGSMFIAVNRNKKGITLDIGKPAGQQIVRRLAALSDVLIENYKTGDLARYGLDAASMRQLNPRLVYCSVTGFGQSGPYREKPGYDPIFQAMGGWMSVNGDPDKPMIAAANMVDTITGYFAAMSVLASLYHRDRGDDPAGKGQSIDIALLEVAIASINQRAQDYLMNGEQPPRRDTFGVVYPCADGSMIIAVANTGQWTRFCGVLGIPEWATDPEYATHLARMKRKEAIYTRLYAITRTRKVSELWAALDAVEVPAAPVYDFRQVFDDPHAKARGVLVESTHASGKTIPLIRSPMRFSDTPIDEYRAPPQLGQHTDEVLHGLLGMDSREIARLRDEGVI
jgi:crotonobetainyl-CoA:carnitine CoA-transferase CaiB-like acyl-CoA transferase